MSHDEAYYKTKIVNDLRKAGVYARRFEDKWTVGFPDMMVILPKVGVVFIEAKMVRGKQFSPSPRQYVELKALHAPWCYTFGVVLGIREDPVQYGLSFPAPVVPVDGVSWGPNFLDGLWRLLGG